ncbi:MAG TPA: S9 family peptidase [Thermoanaerobaculia bacterium]|jgi:dipeptidyl aminopeptidase/acylaminoacyl peptidase|nr:S9 family peptidase [Thermoanaerobaculia bacterium]
MPEPTLRFRPGFALVLLALACGCGTSSHSAPAVRTAAATPQPPAVVAPPPTAIAAPTYTIEQFLGTTTYFGSSFSPDGSKVLVSSDQSGVLNAYALPVAGGEPIQLTRSEDTVRVVGYFPNDERFLFQADHGGNELTHVYVRELDGSVRDLTPGEKVKAEFGAWAADDRSFFVITNERDPSFFDLYQIATDGYQRKLVFQNDGGYDLAGVSPDQRWLALSKTKTTLDSDLFLYDLTRKETKLLTPHEGESSHDAGPFSRDGAWLYYRTNEGREFQQLMRYEISSGRRESVLAPEWDVSGAVFAKDGRYLAVWINRDARTEIRLFEMPGMKPVQLPALPDAEISTLTFSADGKKLAFYADSARSPANLHVYDLATRELRPLTRALEAGIDPAQLVDAQVVRFRARDGVIIPGLLYQPKGASPTHPAPAVIWVHGGPGDQSRVGYRALIQYLVNHGYAVYAINNRGSSGYGKTFFQMDDRKHGEADLDDCVDAKKMLEATGWVDPAKIGILGGSYGGYMVLAALAFRPQEFAVGVDVYGVSNWVRTLESIPAWWESTRQAIYKEMGDPAVDHDYLVKISPLFHADRIEKPLIVLQGANDPRVLKVESDEIVAAVKKKGVPVEYVVIPDEGHGFAKKENQAKSYEAILRFLDRYLKGGQVG